MKTFKMADLLKKDHKALNEELDKLKAQLLQVKTKAISRKSSDDSSEAGRLKKQIARLNTALNQPEQVKEVKATKKEKDNK